MKRFSPAKRITKRNLEHVPDDLPGVYRIIDRDSKLVYIDKAWGGRWSVGLRLEIWLHRGGARKGYQFQYRTTDTDAEANALWRAELDKRFSRRRR